MDGTFLFKKHNDITWNEELQHQRTTKQKSYQKWLNTKDLDDSTTYKRQQTKFKNMTKKNKNDTWERKCIEVNSYLGGTRSSEAWKIIRNLKSNTVNKVNFRPIQMKKKLKKIECHILQTLQKRIKHRAHEWTLAKRRYEKQLNR